MLAFHLNLLKFNFEIALKHLGYFVQTIEWGHFLLDLSSDDKKKKINKYSSQL